MVIDSALLTKGVLGVIGASSVVGGGVAAYIYSDDLLSLFNKETYLIGVTSSANTVPSGKTLFETKGENKIKKYKCQFGDKKEKQFSCDIVKNINSSGADLSKKQHNSSELKINEKVDTTITETIVSAENNYFVLKINEKVDLTDETTIKIIENTDNSPTTFSTITILGGWKKEQKIGKFSSSIGKVSKVATTTFTPSDSNSYKCGFSKEESKLKPCKIYDFSDDETSANATSTHSALTFKGTKTATTSAITINKHYFVELTETGNYFSQIDFEKQSTLFLNFSDSSSFDSTKFIEFKTNHPLVLHPVSSAHTAFIFN